MKESDIRNREVFNKYLELSQKDILTYFSVKEDFTVIQCPACKSVNSNFSFEKIGFTYMSCNDCDTLYVSPRPSIQQYDFFYRDSPSTSFWVNEFFKPVAEARREKIFRPRAEFISDYFKDSRNLILGDIGAGFGIFLEELKKIKREFELIAIEPSHEMGEICVSKGLQLIPKLIEDVYNHDGYFDVLVAFELFEHLQNPEEFVKKCHTLLKPGGILIFTTLNGHGFDIQVLWDKSNSISPPHHINFFNPNSASILLKNNGFEIMEASTPGKLDWDIVESGILNGDKMPERIWKTISKHVNSDSKSNLQKWITESNMSSHMRIIAKKSNQIIQKK